ncbi:MAG: D-isomer specific 2-hydroxyacid dehydrogenase, NAD-binding protein [Parcubacteria group bacterium GW2011_GWB1_44_7]|uniref:D-isomer specific 2-hydroxyacid dehydrogenase, NAD-binding protein n=1 Tax=Candidatus Giovannonibacteria bacterium GW2011_GWA2_45_21 TaxID=1618649 RepID=A0A0G1Q819_9BACT|nr:MAG: D-isomer specific 2-hydroxyacid dehydrogenase, NAD-binding protein [Parcubacteria group bacterium GW2011_GWB1_44_7]KKU04730.1 MAG: D-isomer specific 2-hydroxyacid dehydrogenase, NAD-binding protein [Candidatus Giovannonibacteria bacterium GW2011_GWA2_45_21]
MAKIFITHKIPEICVKMLKDKGHDVEWRDKSELLPKTELLKILGGGSYDGVLCLLTDRIDIEVFTTTPATKIFANYAVGFDNIDIIEAKKRGVAITNTPGASTESVAEHTLALLLALTRRVVEGDAFVRNEKYQGWDPMLLWGVDLLGKTLGILGAGRIGAAVAKKSARGFGMKIIYHDIVRNKKMEKETGANFLPSLNEVLKQADVISLHVPLLPTTKHLINAERLAMMKKTAYLINTSRGSVIDEVALVDGLKKDIIRGAALDVFENEPVLAEGLKNLPNVVLTPHIASATAETRNDMAKKAAENLIAFFDEQKPPNEVGI